MFPYQLSKVLADQRIGDRIAAAERHSLIAAATARAIGRTGPGNVASRAVTAQIGSAPSWRLAPARQGPPRAPVPPP